MENKIKVGITHGDVNGINYEVILKVLEDDRILELCTPILYGCNKAIGYYRRGLEMGPVPFNTIETAADARPNANNLICVVGDDIPVYPGASTAEAGRAAYAALERAVADLKNGDIDVLVTAPINKNNIQSDEFRFAGHTEYLAQCAGDDARALMILFNDRLRVALVTTHCPISQVAAEITTDRIVEKLKDFAQSLQMDFALTHPRIAVLGLNPHAGDGGVIGSEETEIIAPAIEQARAAGVNSFGPYPADGFFGAEQYRHFDGVLAMYHDQGLAPFKTLAMSGGVNYTAGLPFVRTSPDHGTGYDIAGKGQADPESLRQAIYAAIDIYRNRDRWAHAHRNPLRRQYFDKSKDNVVLDLTKES